MNNNEEQFIKNDETLYDKNIKSVPKPETNIGIDTKDSFYKDIISSFESSSIDMSKFEAFSNVSQSRDQIYTMLDTMAEDGRISAVLETYAEDATEYNDQGKIVWAESSDPNISKYVTFLLDTLNVDKNIYKWVYSLCKYGDLYLRLYRESDFKDPFFNGDDDKNKPLNEQLKLSYYDKGDRYAHYMESCPNPAEMFELTRFGKTYGYIKANVGVSNKKAQSSSIGFQTYQYGFKTKDVEVFQPTEFVHACLDDNTSRTPEEVKLFIEKDGKESDVSSTYTVRRGQSLLYSAFKVWRELMLLENSVMLNRVTKSSIVRVIGVEVGDMPKENVVPHLNGIKSMIEQKSAINEGNSLNEYTNPGPIENNIYVPTRNGIGALTPQQIGGDVDVKSLADLDYFKNKFYGTLRIPKQYFGETDDATGFNGGTSLSIISSRYAKMVKRIQNTMLQALTDAINLMLLDKNLDSYINKFELHMLAPTTQEELDRRDNVSSKVAIVGDIMNQLGDIEDNVSKLKILKALLSDVITDSEVISVIQEEIDRIESERVSEQGEDEQEDDTVDDNDEVSDDSESSDDFAKEVSDTLSQDVNDEDNEDNEDDEDNLPSPEELGIDMTNNDDE